MFVQSMKFVESHNGSKKDVSVYGQEGTTTTFKLAKMNLAIRGISADLGAKAKKAITDKYKYPTCLIYLKGFEDALASFAREWGSSGIKKTGKNNNTLRYKMELKVAGHDDRLFSSNNDYYFDVFSDKGFH